MDSTAETTTTTTTSKPKWVEALHESERVLRLAESTSGDDRESLIRLAGAWRDIADRYQRTSPSERPA